MSGTSLDGIDVVVVNIENNEFELCSSQTYPWPQELQQALRQLIEKEDSLNEALKLDQLCAEQYALASLKVIETAGLKPADITAIGSHGQTIRHAPQGNPAFTLQIGNPSTIAEKTGITTIADFRSRDIAAGGQGAPLAPAFHQAIFHQPGSSRVILNIGGIANITVINDNQVIGYDTGPGNRLLDDWISKSKGESFDRNGDFSASGKVNKQLLKQLLQDPYFKTQPPKSTGSDYFNLAWLESRLQDYPDESGENIQATLSALTCTSITQEILASAPDCQEVLVCGGGVHNLHLMQQLQQLLPDMPVVSTEKYGIHPDWVEAMAFAWLAQQTLAGLPGNVPGVTGASGPRICGGIYYS